MLGLTSTITAVLALATTIFAAPTTDAFPNILARQGYVSNCATTYTVASGDTCLVIVNKYNGAFTLDTFYAWNPQISSTCNNLYPGEQVCVGVTATTPPPPPAGGCPAPVLSGLATNCDDCYKVVEGDSCWAVTQTHGVTLADFLSWNPSVNAACTNLQVGYNYCVGVAA